MANNPYTTLVSVRIENSTLKAIDKLCDNRYYLKRSAVINQALKKVFALKDDKDIYDFLYNGGSIKQCDTKN